MQQLAAESKPPAWFDIDFSTLQRGTSARQNWQLNELTSYVYEIEQHCCCDAPLKAHVYVQQERVTWVENLENGQLINTPEILSRYKTIPQLFDQIDRVMAQKPDSLTVEHDRYLGFPARFLANPRFLIADDEINYRIHWLKLLPAD